MYTQVVPLGRVSIEEIGKLGRYRKRGMVNILRLAWEYGVLKCYEWDYEVRRKGRKDECFLVFDDGSILHLFCSSKEINPKFPVGRSNLPHLKEWLVSGCGANIFRVLLSGGDPVHIFNTLSLICRGLKSGRIN